jgi:hypothetical protein
VTADHGWLLAGDLRVGEAVRLLDGGSATVVALSGLLGVGPMWDLALDDVHTFAVDDVQVVVHNQVVLHNCDFRTFQAQNSGAFGSREEAKYASTH